MLMSGELSASIPFPIPSSTGAASDWIWKGDDADFGFDHLVKIFRNQGIRTDVR